MMTVPQGPNCLSMALQVVVEKNTEKSLKDAFGESINDHMQQA